MPETNLTVEDIMKKQKYLNILRVIQEYSKPNSKEKITIKHLRYVLLKNYKPSPFEKKEMDEFFSTTPFKRDKKKEIEKSYRNKECTRNQYLYVMKILNTTIIDKMIQEGVYLNNYKIPSDAMLRKYLRILKSLDLVRLKPRKKGDPYYVLTQLGMVKILRVMLHKTVDLIPEGTNAMLEAFASLSLSIFRQKVKDKIKI